MGSRSRRYGVKRKRSHYGGHGGVSNRNWNEESNVPEDAYQFDQNTFQPDFLHGNGGSSYPNAFDNEGPPMMYAHDAGQMNVDGSSELFWQNQSQNMNFGGTIDDHWSSNNNSIGNFGQASMLEQQARLVLRNPMGQGLDFAPRNQSNDEINEQSNWEPRSQFGDETERLNWIPGGHPVGEDTRYSSQVLRRHVDDDNRSLNWMPGNQMENDNPSLNWIPENQMENDNRSLNWIPGNQMADDNPSLNWLPENQMENDNRSLNWIPGNQMENDNRSLNWEPEPGSYTSNDNGPVNIVADNMNLNWGSENHFNESYDSPEWVTMNEASHIQIQEEAPEGWFEDHRQINETSNNNGAVGDRNFTWRTIKRRNKFKLKRTRNRMLSNAGNVWNNSQRDWIPKNNVKVSLVNETYVQTFERTRVEVEPEPFVGFFNSGHQQSCSTSTVTSQFYSDEMESTTEENRPVPRTSVNDSFSESVLHPANRKGRKQKLSRSRARSKRMFATEVSFRGEPTPSFDGNLSCNWGDGYEESNFHNGTSWIRRSNGLETEFFKGPLLSSSDFNVDMSEVDAYPPPGMLHDYQFNENYGYDDGSYEDERGVPRLALEYNQKRVKKKKKSNSEALSRTVVEPIRKSHVQANQLLYIYFEQAILGFCKNISEEQIREKFQQLWIEFMLNFFKRFWEIIGFKVESDSDEFPLNHGLIDITQSATKTVRQRFDEIEIRHPSYHYTYFCKSTKKISEVLQREKFSKKLFKVLTPMLLESVYMEEAVGVGLTNTTPNDNLKIKCTAHLLHDLRQIPGKCAVQMVLSFEDETDPKVACIKRTRRCRFLAMMFEKLGRKYANRQIKHWLWGCTDFEKERFNSDLALLKKKAKPPQKWKRFRRKWRMEGRERNVRDLIYGAAAVKAELGLGESWTEEVKDVEPTQPPPTLNRHIRFVELEEDDDDQVEENFPKFVDPALLWEDENSINEAVKDVVNNLISDVEKIPDLRAESAETVNVESFENVNLTESEHTLILDESPSSEDDESVEGKKDFDNKDFKLIENIDEETVIILDNIIENVIRLETL